MKLKAEFSYKTYKVYEEGRYSALAEYELDKNKKLVLVACKDLSKEKEAREFLKQFVEVYKE